MSTHRIPCPRLTPSVPFLFQRREGVAGASAITSPANPSRPIITLRGEGDHRRGNNYYDWLQTLSDADEAARKWAAFSNIPNQARVDSEISNHKSEIAP